MKIDCKVRNAQEALRAARTLEKARLLFKHGYSAKETDIPGIWECRNPEGKVYRVDMRGEQPTCDCPAFQEWGDYCKHTWGMMTAFDECEEAGRELLKAGYLFTQDDPAFPSIAVVAPGKWSADHFILEGQCDCQDFARYGGFCNHTAAWQLLQEQDQQVLHYEREMEECEVYSTGCDYEE